MNDTPRVVYGAVAETPATPIRETWGTLRSLVTPAIASSQNLEITEIVINPGTPPGPRHYHARAENAFLILEGRVIMEVDGTQFELGAGDYAWVRPGAVHEVRNASSSERVRLIEIYGPAGRDFNVVDSEDV